ncbi:MAG: YebC/PmpR family DNA-binding transcriptional regulator [Gemmatimonadetes bacterium]|nr:YebC/PmpR family DNA-binding transcriptional regulator [Gemmatimonadota bacterium]
MSGHSKWATIKRKKAVVDAKRGKIFTRLAREIITAARSGGGDPSANARLRTAIAAARAENMPNANIDKAIKRGTGEIDGAAYEEVTYEGYGPGGVALFVDVTTDNRNRTVGEVRHALTKHNGSLGENGCVAWMFELKGSIVIPAEGLAEDAMMEHVVESGAEDFAPEGEGEDAIWQVTTAPADLFAVKEALEARGVTVRSAELVRVPQNTVKLEGKDAETMLKLMDVLEDLDDVQRVSANFDIPDEILQSLGG